MEGANIDSNKANADTKGKILNNNEIDKKQDEKDILPVEQKKASIELKENNVNMNLNIDNKIDIEEEKVFQNNNEEIEKHKKEIINKEIYRTRLTSIKETSCRNVNNYKIIEGHIGEGTFGQVFKAEYIGDPIYAEKNGIPKKVALKKIKMEDSKEGFPITL